MMSCYHQNTMSSRNMQSHAGDQSIPSDWHNTAQPTEWTATNHPIFRPHFLGLWQTLLEIHMSQAAQDTLGSVCGKTAQLQNTVYLAPMRHVSATTLVSVKNSWVFQTALMALTEPCTIWQRITRFPLPTQWIALHTISKCILVTWSLQEYLGGCGV